MKKYTLTKSKTKNKKWNITNGKTINFGDSRYDDFTLHKNPNRKKLYIARHKKRENWNKSGINTAAFWSKHLLWNKNTLNKSIKDTEDRFKINIIKK